MHDSLFMVIYYIALLYCLTSILLIIGTKIFPSHSTRVLRECFYWWHKADSYPVTVLKASLMVVVGVGFVSLAYAKGDVNAEDWAVYTGVLLTTALLYGWAWGRWVYEVQEKLYAYYANSYFAAKELLDKAQSLFDEHHVPIIKRKYVNGDVVYILSGTVEGYSRYSFKYYDGQPVAAYGYIQDCTTPIPNSELQQHLAILDAYRAIYVDHCGCPK